MHEVNNPLEALTNLVFLTKLVSEEPEKVLENMEIAEQQLSYLANITRKTLSFYRDQSEAKDFDLVEIAESALKIHAARARKQGVASAYTYVGHPYSLWLRMLSVLRVRALTLRCVRKPGRSCRPTTKA
jgi:signal transduction histidine kinase